MLLAAALLTTASSCAPRERESRPADHFIALERSARGRIGVAALDTSTGECVGHRAGERFALCSTFKLVLVASVLSQVDRGEESLSRRVAYDEPDLLDYAPVTKERAREGAMTVEDLCAAAVEVSDNTAANLLLRETGGPEALTRFLRALGDRVTRLDRNEPSLNSNLPGDKRDTTSPAAMVETMRKLLMGDALSPESRRLLLKWMVACKTGGDRLRAGIPPAWRAGDKTGSGANGAANDIAILWPPGRPPILAAVYFTGSPLPAKDRDAVLARIGRIIAHEFAGAGDRP
jgi:beta-lactamase class A